MKPKYRNRKTVINGITFDSAKEAGRYRQLAMLEKAGHIRDLELQKRYTLIPLQRKADGKAERPVTYIADFVYEQDGRVVVEDVKGVKTPDYIIKRKLLLQVHGITVTEV